MSRWMRFLSVFAVIRSWNPRSLLGSRTLVAAGMLVVGGLAFGVGRWIGVGAAVAQQPVVPAKGIGPAGSSGYDDGYNQRVVAYIYGNVPITRTELAEYLIARFGKERLEFLVNRKIVERECQAKGIFVTEAEIEDQFARDLRNLGPHMTAKMFQEQVLKRYNKTIFEWKEDVIRPKILMTKLVRSDVQVTDADLKKGFEIQYGPKVQCRMCVYKDKKSAVQAWEKIKQGPSIETAFLAEAGNQYIQQLAATKGEIPPIHMHFGDANIEREAFTLERNQISQVIGMSDGTAVILLCVAKLPADPTRRLENEREVLYREIFEMKLAQKIQDTVVEMRRRAAPQFFLARQPGMEQIGREALEEIDPENLQFKGIDRK